MGFKWSELSSTEKCLKILAVTTGFASGCIVGGAVNSAMKSVGKNAIISDAVGIASAIFYIKVCDVLGDVVIDAQRDIKS